MFEFDETDETDVLPVYFRFMSYFPSHVSFWFSPLCVCLFGCGFLFRSTVTHKIMLFRPDIGTVMCFV